MNTEPEHSGCGQLLHDVPDRLHSPIAFVLQHFQQIRVHFAQALLGGMKLPHSWALVCALFAVVSQSRLIAVNVFVTTLAARPGSSGLSRCMGPAPRHAL